MDLKSWKNRFTGSAMSYFGNALLFTALLLAGGCSSIGRIQNAPVVQLPEQAQRYSFQTYMEQHGLGDIFFVLAFSGGGTRASALSYGVLEELKNTRYEVDGRTYRLLDEVDRINGVSGGSFTASYYGLYGEEIFTQFKEDFLYKDIEGELESRIFNFFYFLGRVFNKVSRTEDAIRIYDRHLFKDKTFADLQRSGNPFILINATDLNSHNQFVFAQDYFDMLCSDLSSLKVSRAVAASSAVPLLFDPVLIESYQGCDQQKPDWLIRAKRKADKDNNSRLHELVDSFEYYLDPANPPFATLVDGGVTDNLGLRAMLSNIMLFEGTEKMEETLQQAKGVKRVVVLVVNASTKALTDIGKSREMPSFADVITAVTDMQLHRYNLESNSLMKEELHDWAESVVKDGRTIKPYFVELSIGDVANPELSLFFNKIPTSLALEQDQVDKVIDIAKYLLRQDPDYQELLSDLGVRAFPEQ